MLDRRAEDDVVRLQIRYRFVGDLSPAVTAVVDPGKLTWVEHSTHDLVRRSVTYRLAPDHYPDRLQSSGTCTVSDDGGTGTLRTVHGRLKVRALVVGGAVERAIVSGLREYLVAEADAVDRVRRRAAADRPRPRGVDRWRVRGRDNRCMGDRLDLVDLIDESGWPYADQVAGAGSPSRSTCGPTPTTTSWRCTPCAPARSPTSPTSSAAAMLARFGLDGRPPLSMVELRSELGLSRDGTRLALSGGLAKLRRALTDDGR